MSLHIKREKLDREYENLLASARDLVSATSDVADAKAKEARAKLQAQLSEAEAAFGRVERHAADAVHGVEDYTRRQPLQALGMAFAAGWLFSCLRGRK